MEALTDHRLVEWKECREVGLLVEKLAGLLFGF